MMQENVADASKTGLAATGQSLELKLTARYYGEGKLSADALSTYASADMTKAIQKIFNFFLIKIVTGIVVIVGLVALTEWLGNLLLSKTKLTNDIKELVLSVANSLIAVSGYVLLFKAYDKRRIEELSASAFSKNAIIGSVTGMILQALFVLVIYEVGTYSIVHVNSTSTLINAFSFALTAGFVAETLIIGVLFRLLEEQSGTVIALIALTVLFAMLHVKVEGATFVSICSTAIQAGFMLPAAYVFSRSLWLPIFFHFGWDFTEPGVFGGINPSTSNTSGLFTSKMEGSQFITGGRSGPQDSLQALILCLLTGLVFLILAKKRNNLIRGRWRTAMILKK